MVLKATLAAALLATTVLTAAPALAKHDSSGVNLENDKSVTTLTSSRTGHATFKQSQLTAAKAKLSKDQAAKFDAVRKVLAKYPAAQNQVGALLVKNRLKQKDVDGHTVLDDLNKLATSPTNHGINAADALCDLVADITRPSTIAQAQHNTCTATAVQASLARAKPQEYARAVAGLATAGHVTLNGLTLTADDYIAFKDRSISSNLMQPAIMEAEAQVQGGHYRNKVDKTYPKKGKPYEGAEQGDVAAVESHLLSGHYVVLEADEHHENAKKVRSIMMRATADNPILMGVSMAGGDGHEIQLVGFDGHKNEYKVRNPWGQVHLVPADKLEKGVGDLTYRKD